MDSGVGVRERGGSAEAVSVAKGLLQSFSRANDRSAIIQLSNSIVPYLVLWALMLWATSVPVVLLLSSVAALFLLRLFVLQHDCGHGSFLSTPRKNDLVGCALSLITFTPLYNWRVLHNLHHATSGNLDRRGMGDIWLLTTEEYRAAGSWKKLRYRFYRHPLFLFVIGPGFYFLFRRRFPIKLAPHLKKAKVNVYLTDLAIVLLYGTVGYFFGWGRMLLIAFPIIAISASLGVWLFYVQHHFEGAYWKRHEKWDHFTAGMEGSSYYQLPRWLHWFTADIAVHHIHHIDSRVPNYRLTECMRSHPALAPTKRLGFRESLKLASLTLWDESQGKLVEFPA